MTRRDLIRSGSVSDPWGWLLVAVLCALAGAGQALLVSSREVPMIRPDERDGSVPLTDSPNHQEAGRWQAGTDYVTSPRDVLTVRAGDTIPLDGTASRWSDPCRECRPR